MMTTWLMLVCRVGTGVGVGVGVGIGVGDGLGVGVGDGCPGVGVGVGRGVIPVIRWQPARTRTRSPLTRQSEKCPFPMVIECHRRAGVSTALEAHLCGELLALGLDVGPNGSVATPAPAEPGAL